MWQPRILVNFFFNELILLSGSPRHYVPRDDNGDYFAHFEHQVRVTIFQKIDWLNNHKEDYITIALEKFMQN